MGPHVAMELAMNGDATASASAAEARLRHARRIDARVRMQARVATRNEVVIARLLARMERYDRYAALGYASLNAYAFEVAAWGATKTSRFVTLVKRLKGLPVLKREFF